MHNSLSVDTIHVEPGQNWSGYAAVALGPAHAHLPLIIANGARPGPRLALTAGVHYGEYIGIEALRELARQIDPATLAGQLVACPLACPPSFYDHRSGVSPLDGLNPNRVYPGSASGRPTERLVHWLFENVMRGADVFIDLHSGGVSEDLASFVGYRASGNAEQDRRAIELAGLFGMPIVRGASAAGGNSHAAATRSGIVALLVESGSRGSRAPSEIDGVREGLQRVMHHLGMLEQAPPLPAVRIEHWHWGDEVEAPVAGFWYPEFEVGDEVASGAVLGRICDPLDTVLGIISAPHAGKIFYGERGLAVASGDVLAALAVRET